MEQDTSTIDPMHCIYPVYSPTLHHTGFHLDRAHVRNCPMWQVLTWWDTSHHMYLIYPAYRATPNHTWLPSGKETCQELFNLTGSHGTEQFHHWPYMHSIYLVYRPTPFLTSLPLGQNTCQVLTVLDMCQELSNLTYSDRTGYFHHWPHAFYISSLQSTLKPGIVKLDRFWYDGTVRNCQIWHVVMGQDNFSTNP